MNSAETEVNQKVLSLKPNQTLLDIYPLANAEDDCNEAKLPGLYCHPLRVNSTISGTTRLLCPRIESCEPPEACLLKIVATKVTWIVTLKIRSKVIDVWKVTLYCRVVKAVMLRGAVNVTP